METNNEIEINFETINDNQNERQESEDKNSNQLNERFVFELSLNSVIFWNHLLDISVGSVLSLTAMTRQKKSGSVPVVAKEPVFKTNYYLKTTIN